MKISYDGYMVCFWQDNLYIGLEVKGVIKVLPIIKNGKKVRVTIEEIPDNSIPISAMPVMATV